MNANIHDLSEELMREQQANRTGPSNTFAVSVVAAPQPEPMSGRGLLFTPAFRPADDRMSIPRPRRSRVELLKQILPSPPPEVLFPHRPLQDGLYAPGSSLFMVSERTFSGFHMFLAAVVLRTLPLMALYFIIRMWGAS